MTEEDSAAAKEETCNKKQKVSGSSEEENIEDDSTSAEKAGEGEATTTTTTTTAQGEAEDDNDNNNGNNNDENDDDEENKFDWPPLESNPTIFTEYLYKIGLSYNFAIGEVYGFDEELLCMCPQPIYGIIVAMERYDRNKDISYGTPYEELSPELVNNNGLYYMDQSGTLDNACGIIACLHCIYNLPQLSIQEDSVMNINESILGRHYKHTKNLSSDEKCIALETNNEFKTLHKSFASIGQTQAINQKDEQNKIKHHYVAFIKKNNTLIELDGTKIGPNIIETTEGGEGEDDNNNNKNNIDLLRCTIKEIQKRLKNNEISDRLNMMILHGT